MRNTKILVVDDEHLIRWSLEQSLKKQGYEVTTAASGEEALKVVQDDPPELMLLDIQLPGMDGLQVLEKVKEFDSEVIILMVTALGVLETAVKAMRMGAYDYINKPFNLDELSITVKKALETRDLRKEVAHLRSDQEKKFGIDNIIGDSRHMCQVLDMVRKVAKSDASTVLIQGESGTGKELIARAIHLESARREKPFMAINCAAVPETLLESELMGHEKGAFTDAKSQKRGLFEMSDGGTIFLDEIGDMEMGMQAKLLRVLEERSFRRVGGTKEIPVDVRIVSATNQELLKKIEDKSFRNDLYYRLQVIPIYLPALRERRDDIMLLVDFFIAHYNREFGKDVKGVSKMAQKFLEEYEWPGNVRELRNIIERAIILENEETLMLEHLPRELVSKTGEVASGPMNLRIPPEGIDIEDVERELIRQALEVAEGNQSKAAKKLNLGIDAFRYRMKKFGFLGQ
ncbi:MAG: sigma-54 dependent transcriptional regulator [Desulfuromonadales bacterium]|nr:sigma-54 dependent transcriptional regulator [Desulfuromonadales bacterium]